MGYRKIRTMESWMVANGKVGEVFYTEHPDKDITALSSYHKRKLKTERVFVTNYTKDEIECKRITKVTLL